MILVVFSPTGIRAHRERVFLDRHVGFLRGSIDDVVALAMAGGIGAEDKASGVFALKVHEDVRVFFLEALQNHGVYNQIRSPASSW